MTQDLRAFRIDGIDPPREAPGEVLKEGATDAPLALGGADHGDGGRREDRVERTGRPAPEVMDGFGLRSL